MVLEVLRALARRWWVALLGLLLTAGMVMAAYQSSPPKYHARGLVLLLPSQSAVGKGGNPLLLLSGLEQPAGILVAYFSSADAQAEVKTVSKTAEYQVAIDDSTRGPVIAVDVTAESARDTLLTLGHIINRIPDELALLQRQVDAPGNAAVSTFALTVDQKAQADRSGSMRMVIAALVLGLVITGLAGVGVDSLIRRREMRDWLGGGSTDVPEGLEMTPQRLEVPPERLGGRGALGGNGVRRDLAESSSTGQRT